MKKCNSCGAVYQDNVQVCPSCGGNLTYIAQQNTPQNGGNGGYNSNPYQQGQYNYNSYQAQNSGQQYQQPQPQKKKLSGGAIAGIVIGGVVSLILIISLIVVIGASSGSSSTGNTDYDIGTDVTEQMKAFELGKVSDGIYSNDFFNLHFDTSGGKWRICSDKENDDFYSSEDITYDKETGKKKYVNSGTTTYYDVVMTDGKSDSIQVMYSDMPYTDNEHSTEDYLDVFIENLNDLGTVNSKSDIYSKEIGGKTYSSIDASITAGGRTVTQTYAVTKIDNYFAVICITMFDKDEDANRECLDLFY